MPTSSCAQNNFRSCALIAVCLISSASGAARVRVAAGTALPRTSADGKVRPNRWRARIDWQAAPGTFEPGAIVIEAQDAIAGVRVLAGALAGPGGARIPARNIRLHRLRMRGARSRDGKLIVVPEFLLPLEGPFDLKAGKTAILWVTIFVPKDARPGAYLGRVSVCHSAKRPRATPRRCSRSCANASIRT